MYWDNLIVSFEGPSKAPNHDTSNEHEQEQEHEHEYEQWTTKITNFSWLSLIIDSECVNEKCQWKRRETRSEFHILFGVKIKTKPSWIDTVNWIELNQTTEMSNPNCIQLTQCVMSIWFWHIHIHTHSHPYSLTSILTHTHSHLHSHSHLHFNGLSYNNNPIGNKFYLKELIY